MLLPPSCEKRGISTPYFIVGGIIVVLIVAFSSVYLYQKGISDGMDSHAEKYGMVYPIIDGDITYDEWKGSALYMYPQWIKFNTSGSESGWNYLFIGQDDYSLYIALDLLSIKEESNNEYIGIFLITGDKYFDTFSQYMILQDWGVEAIIYNASSGSIEYDNQLNTIRDASVGINITSSFISEQIHQSVEIGIPKSELRYFESSGQIGVLVTGNYGADEFYFSSRGNNVTYYDAGCYIGVDLGAMETVYA